MFQCNTRECDGVPERHGVRSLPTFIFYKNRQEQPDLKFVGADVEKLERVVQQNIMPTTFTGSGNRLGGGGGGAAHVPSAAPTVNTRPQGLFPTLTDYNMIEDFDVRRMDEGCPPWPDFKSEAKVEII